MRISFMVLLILILAISVVAQQNSVQAIAVPGINSDAIEYAPTISADGKTMIFQSNRNGRYQLLEATIGSDGVWGNIAPIDSINNFGDENDLIGGPSISFDGNTLYFFADFEGSMGDQDIYYSVRKEAGWSAPINPGYPVNTGGYEAFPSISADGQTLYLVKNNFEGPTNKDLIKKVKNNELSCTGIFKSELISNGTWGVPVKLPFPINVDCEKAPRIMADNKTLIFSSLRPGGSGSFDLWQSRLNELGEWTHPVNLTYVNTPTSDQSPCISASGDVLYFVYGGSDIYSVDIPVNLRQFVNNVVTGFVTDQDLGVGLEADIIITDALNSDVVSTVKTNAETGKYTVVLTAGRSYNVEVKKDGYSNHTSSYDLRNATVYREFKNDAQLFASVRLNLSVSDMEIFEAVGASVTITNKGSGQLFSSATSDPQTGHVILDLPVHRDYRIEVTSDNFKPVQFDFDLTRMVMYRDYERDIELDPEKVDVFINIGDIAGGGRVKSRVRIRNKTRDEIIEVDGNQMVSLRAGDRYEIEATSDQGYAFNSTELDLTNVTPETIVAGIVAAPKVEMELQKLEENTTLTLKDINFESNSVQISENSFTELQRVVKLMNENPGLKVEISAHTDDIGSTTFNLVLSNKRAQSVVDFMVDSQIDKTRFVAKGYGEGTPKLPNENDENRALNRRVELKILAVES